MSTLEITIPVDAVDLVASWLAREGAPSRSEIDAVADAIVQACLSNEERTLSELTDALRRIDASDWPEGADWTFARGEAHALLVVSLTALDRLPSDEVVGSVGPHTHAHHILTALAEHESLGAGALATELGLRPDELSRNGAKLLNSMLVTRLKLGREVFWEITPRGRDVLARIERANGPSGQPDPARRLPGHVLDAMTWGAFTFGHEQLRTAFDATTSVEHRSRVMLVDLLARRPEALTESIAKWPSLAEFAINQPCYFAVAPDAGAPAIEASLWRVLDSALGETLPRAEWRTLAPPRFDAYALVDGTGGRTGVVLIEAKTEPREFNIGALRASSPSSKALVRDVLDQTCNYLGVSRRWKASVKYPDAVRRLAFMRHLKEHGIDAWLLNAYFIDPWSGEFGLLPVSSEWQHQIVQIRESLSLADDHPLREFIAHEYFRPAWVE